jgi:hypothetical protein
LNGKFGPDCFWIFRARRLVKIIDKGLAGCYSS